MFSVLFEAYFFKEVFRFVCPAGCFTIRLAALASVRVNC